MTGLRFEHSEDDNLNYLRAFLDGEPNQAGLISWGKKHNGVIYEVYVRPEYQRQGIATAMYREAATGKHGIPVRMGPVHSSPECEAWCQAVEPHDVRPWDFTENYWDRLDRAVADGEWS